LHPQKNTFFLIKISVSLDEREKAHGATQRSEQENGISDNKWKSNPKIV
jgi:hypothetical protein